MLPRKKLLLLGNYEDPALPILHGWLKPHFAVKVMADRMTAPVSCDWIISYRYHYRVPAECLVPNAINFHPAPYWHRGVGGPDWAIKEGWPAFGVTAHYMTADIDAGPIIAWGEFAIWPDETVASLNQRAHAHLLALASDVLLDVARGSRPAAGATQWQGPLHTRKQLDAFSPHTKPCAS